ncbi:MAG: PQQ-dependent sugar dehydrogenase [Actinomycetota bacterium]|nr:PQQ-dependent sugar dehydrogenase [Actinomycetota bacterium]
MLALGLVACSSSSDTTDAGPATTAQPGGGAPAPPSPAPGSSPSPGPVVATFNSAGARLQVTEVARDLDTVWSLRWDPAGALWYTERPGRLTKLGEQSQPVQGVDETGEGGLMGLEIDGRGRKFVMYTGADDNRVVRLEPDGSQRVLVKGIEKAGIHNGGRLRFGPDGTLYASAGDAARTELSPDPGSINGKVLRIDPESGNNSIFSRGHRNVQGLCFAPGGRFLATEHGPSGNDEVNALVQGFDGGWPRTSGNGIKNYPSSVAPSGCAVYGGGLIPAWRGSMLFGTLRGTSLRRLTFDARGSVTGEEVLLSGELGRVRDVAEGPDGAVYVATSNRDGRGRPRNGDDRIVRIGPVPQL